MLKKTLALAALAGAIATFAPTGNAEAGKLRLHLHGWKHHHFHGHHWRSHRYDFGCRYYYKKWKWTGSRYWKRKYYRCIS